MPKRPVLLCKFCWECQHLYSKESEKCPECGEELQPVYNFLEEPV